MTPKEKEYKLPPDIVPLYQFSTGNYDVVVAWEEKPRHLLNFYFDVTSEFPIEISSTPMFDVHKFKKL